MADWMSNLGGMVGAGIGMSAGLAVSNKVIKGIGGLETPKRRKKSRKRKR
jgi:hypothetical protein